jgi:hypothetical protein
VQSTNQNSKAPKLHIILSFKSFFNFDYDDVGGGRGRVHEMNKKQQTSTNKQEQNENHEQTCVKKLHFMSQLLQ